MKKIVGITGADGVLGKCLYDINNKTGENLFRPFIGDLREKKEITNWIKVNNFDCVIHLAAIVPIQLVNKNINNAWRVNVLGTNNLAEAVLLNGSKARLIYASTSHVYKPNKRARTETSKLLPQNLYGLSKLHAEQILNYYEQHRRLKLTICRIFSFTSIYQPNSYFIPAIVNKIRNLNGHNSIEFKSLNGYRDFMDGHDVARAILHILKKDVNGTINICSGRRYSLRTIVKMCLKSFEKNKVIIVEEKPTRDHLEVLWGNNHKLKELGFKPKLDSMQQILKNYINYTVKR